MTAQLSLAPLQLAIDNLTNGFEQLQTLFDETDAFAFVGMWSG